MTAASILSILLAGTNWTAQFGLVNATSNPQRAEQAGRIRYSHVYPGIHLETYRTGTSGLEYDFIVQPGAAPRQIRMSFNGSTRIEDSGDLLVSSGAAVVRHHAPVTYQMAGGARRPVASRFVRHGAEIGFEVGAYDRTRPLIIDPVVTFSRAIDAGRTHEVKFARDLAGNFYVTGTTSITKLDPNGTILFQRQLPQISGKRIAVDANQNIYVAGTLGSTCPANSTRIIGSVATPGEFVGITKLTPDGLATLYLTCVQLDGSSLVQEIEVDAAGNLYMAGMTNSSVYPASAIHGTFTSGVTHAFVTKVDATGNSFPFSIVVGPPSEGYTVELDSAGNVFLGGSVRSAAFPTVNAPQPAFGGGQEDGFVVKIAPSGLQILMATFFGGSNSEVVDGIALDTQGNMVLTGIAQSNSPNPVLGPLQPCVPAGSFVTRLNASTGALKNSICIPLTSSSAVAVQAGGEVLIAGMITGQAFQVVGSSLPFAPLDAVISKVDLDGRVIFSIPIGGSLNDLATDIVVTPRGFAIAGSTTSSNFPRTAGPAFVAHAETSFLTFYDEIADLVLSSFNGSTLSIRNFGPDVATGVTVAVGVNVATVTSLDSRCAVSSSTRIDCNLGSLNSGALVAPVLVTASDPKISVRSSVFDPNRSNNVD